MNDQAAELPMTTRTRVAVLAMDVDVLDLPQAVARILAWSGAAGAGRSVCVSNVHMCMEVFDSADFRAAVNSADMVVADGKPIQVAQRLLQGVAAGQVRGMDLTLALCAAAARQGLPVGFYGGQASVLEALVAHFRQSLPDLQVAYACSPPFRQLSEEEDREIVDAINASGARILFVGLGCPKQELWMAGHRSRLACTMLGVGAAFDFIAGGKRHAPRWMQALALEWLYRLATEPRRLWRRYATHNPRFIWYFLQQWLLRRRFSGRRSAG